MRKWFMSLLPMLAGGLYVYANLSYGQRRRVQQMLSPSKLVQSSKTAVTTVRSQAGTVEGITPKSILAGAMSFFVWPGLGQAINGENPEKVVTHTVIGAFPPVRIVSGLDALLNRHGGFLHGRV